MVGLRTVLLQFETALTVNMKLALESAVPSESKCDGGVRHLCWREVCAELTLLIRYCSSWEHQDPPDPEQNQRGQQPTNHLLWKGPEFSVCAFTPCTGQWWHVGLWVCYGSCVKLWAMEHNILSENAFWGNLGGESSHVFECCQSYCSDGNLFSYYPKL